jgi:hypothetical protein
MRRANYTVMNQEEDKVVLRDDGPWSVHPTITNAAEEVVAELAPMLHGRRLFYYDSEGEYTELCYKDGVFTGFA